MKQHPIDRRYIQRISDTAVEISTGARSDMRAPCRVYCDEGLWEKISQDRTLFQSVNVATLPGIEFRSLVMPDAHEGYGFPVGGVAAFSEDEGIISPGGVGYDINCGVRLLVSDLEADSLGKRLESLVHELSRSIPTGTGRGGSLDLSASELDRLLNEGSQFLEERNHATRLDIEHTESAGRIADADPGAVSDRAKKRGSVQLGSIGGGNHFVEVQKVSRIFDTETASAYGLTEGQLCVQIHTGSRGLGHQVCTDYVQRMDSVMARHGIQLPDRQLACAPFGTDEGRQYFAAMSAAANFAFANRQMVTHTVREVFQRELGEANLTLLYDVAHNMAKREEHRGKRLLVHRKGATRSFGPTLLGRSHSFGAVGQPVLIPGSMGTSSYVLAGTDRAADETFASCCHGAGRAMSRGAAKRYRHGAEIRRELSSRGIVLRVPGNKELAEEAPHAYKDVDAVVNVAHEAGLARKVAQLVPLGVIKG